jgi:dolichol-phosphate mannosyltransferase
VFYRLLNRITGIHIPVDVGDFRLLSRRAADHLRQLREQDRFVRGLVSWIGFRQTGVTYNRDKRFAGETKYPYRKMLKFALDGITSFSTMPLKVAMWMGYAASGLAFLYLLTVFIQKLLGHTVEGWATIMVALLFLGGTQLICLGIIGEYVGRIYSESKGRPLYIVEEVLGADGAADAPVERSLAANHSHR